MGDFFDRYSFYRQWNFIADMNRDGALTISDLWLWLKWLYFMPGDLFMLAIIETPFGAFFEISGNSFQGGASGFLSFWAWFILVSSYTGITGAASRATRRGGLKSLDEQARENTKESRRDLGYDK